MHMIPAHIVEVVTPKKVLLNGLWFGSKKPKRVIVWVHGLGSSVFSKLDIIDLLARGDTAVLSFNNRGHDTMSGIIRGKKKIMVGSAHEIFEECVDDIDGAVAFARAQEAQDIFLAGHSTGCQKSIYWAMKRKDTGIAGIILLAPIADMTTMTPEQKKLQARATMQAHTLVSVGKSHALLSERLWPVPVDAQRFLSLYTSDSVENSIFPYFDASKTPRILQSVRVSLLVLLAESDEYADRPAKDISAWFTANNRARTFSVSIVSRVTHSFKSGEADVASIIKQWIRAIK